MRQIVVSPEGLGAVLRELRKKKGITQAALGARVGLDQKRVSLIENGNPNIRWTACPGFFPPWRSA